MNQHVASFDLSVSSLKLATFFLVIENVWLLFDGKGELEKFLPPCCQHGIEPAAMLTVNSIAAGFCFEKRNGLARSRCEAVEEFASGDDDKYSP